MNKRFHSALIVLAVLCLCTALPAHGQSSDDDKEMAEQRFHVQMVGALNNDPKSQYNVAQMYERGVGIPQDLGMARMWYTKSANQGYDPAVKKLKNWVSEDQAAKKEAELRARQRAEEQKRREAEAQAKAAAEEQKRIQARQQRAEAQKRREAAARAKAAKNAEEQKRLQAARQQRAEEQKRREAAARAKAAAEAKAAKSAEDQKHREAEAAAAKTSQIAETKTEVKVREKPTKADIPANSHQNTGGKSADKTPVFRANPCDTPTAKFTSTCQ